MSRTLYQVTMSIAGVDEESHHYHATEAEARAEVLEWRGNCGDNTGDAWDVYAHAVIVDVPDDLPLEHVLNLLNRTVVTVEGGCLMANRCADCDGTIEDLERPNAFAVDLPTRTTKCADCEGL